MSPPLTILVVDDVQMNLDMIARFLGEGGHRVFTAASGEDALEQFTKETPDLVLMDVIMPCMDGYETTEQMRKLKPETWVPIIFLSALSDNVDQIRGLEAGGDDYLVKPVNLTLLQAKIRAMQRIAEMQNRLAETTAELQRYHQQAEEEQELAQQLMTRMVSTAIIDDDVLRVWNRGATRFSGDLVAASRAKNGRLYLLNADSMGHGLPAALPLLPVSHIFYAMAESGFSISSIVEEMNNQLSRQMPTGRFVTATLVCVDQPNGTIDIWNGANPPALFFDTNGNCVKEFDSEHTPLGVEIGNRFDSRSVIWQWPEDGTLLLCSDGLTEACNASGDAFGNDRLLSAVQSAKNRHVLESVVASLEKHLNGAPAHDDISLMVVDCSIGASG